MPANVIPTDPIERCVYEQRWMVNKFGPMRDSKIDHIGHMDWLIEELLERELTGCLI